MTPYRRLETIDDITGILETCVLKILQSDSKVGEDCLKQSARSLPNTANNLHPSTQKPQLQDIKMLPLAIILLVLIFGPIVLALIWGMMKRSPGDEESQQHRTARQWARRSQSSSNSSTSVGPTSFHGEQNQRWLKRRRDGITAWLNLTKASQSTPRPQEIVELRTVASTVTHHQYTTRAVVVENQRHVDPNLTALSQPIPRISAPLFDPMGVSSVQHGLTPARRLSSQLPRYSATDPLIPSYPPPAYTGRNSSRASSSGLSSMSLSSFERTSWQGDQIFVRS